MNRERFSKRVQQTITDNDMLHAGDRIVCALSGGPDSVCMVSVLADLRGQMGFDMHLAHVNYHTRGEDSDSEEELCRSLAERLRVEITVTSVDPDGLAALKSGNFQREASRLRFAFFREVMSDWGGTLIATGHTADDVAETALMHFIRGAGISGLGGIYPKHRDTIRPLIDCARADITAYLSVIDMPYRIDSSNLESDYFRNLIRHELIPHLRDRYNSRIIPALTRTAHVAQAAESFIRKYVERLWSEAVSFSRLGKIQIDITQCRYADPILAYELIRKSYYHLTRRSGHRNSLDLELIKEAYALLDSEVGRRADLNSGILVERGISQLVMFENSEIEFSREISVPGRHRLLDFGLGITSRIEGYEGGIDRQTDNWSAELDFDRLSPPFVIRNVRQGDRVVLMNAPGSRKLSDIFTDRKIPRSLRQEIPILTANGAIVWIIGVGIAHSARITEQTGKVLKLHAESDVIQESDV
jgi:tRNA(Ile)-lysidine synthase